MIVFIVLWYLILLQLFISFKFYSYVKSLQQYHENMKIGNAIPIETIVKRWFWIQLIFCSIIFLTTCFWTWILIQTTGTLKKHGMSILIGLIIVYSGVLYANLVFLFRPKKLVYQYPVLWLAIILIPVLVQFPTSKRIRTILFPLVIIGLILNKIWIKNSFMQAILVILLFYLFWSLRLPRMIEKNKKSILPSFISLSIFCSIGQVVGFRLMNQEIASEFLKRNWKKEDWQKPIAVLNTLEEYFVIFKSGVLDLLPVRPIENPYFQKYFEYQIQKKEQDKNVLFTALQEIYSDWNQTIILVDLLEGDAGCLVFYQKKEKANKIYLDIVFRGTKKTSEWAGNILGGINVFSPTDDMRKHAEINERSHEFAIFIKQKMDQYRTLKKDINVYGHSRGTVLAFFTTLQLMRRQDSNKRYELFLVAPPGMFDPCAYKTLLKKKDRLQIHTISHVGDSLHQAALTAPFGTNLFGDAFLIDRFLQDDKDYDYIYIEKNPKKDQYKAVPRKFYDIQRNSLLTPLQKKYYIGLKAHKEPHKILYWYYLSKS